MINNILLEGPHLLNRSLLCVQHVRPLTAVCLVFHSLNPVTQTAQPLQVAAKEVTSPTVCGILSALTRLSYGHLGRYYVVNDFANAELATIA